jgi:hypothetical protein
MSEGGWGAVLRIRIRNRIRKDPKLLAGSGSEITIMDLDSNPDLKPDPKPDPKKICKMESCFQAKKRYFQTIMEFFNIFKE